MTKRNNLLMKTGIKTMRIIINCVENVTKRYTIT